MAPKFLVTAPPGAPIPSVGFVRPGEIFTAPDDYVPSYTMKPVNAEALAELGKVKAKLLARVKELRKNAEDRAVDDAERKSSRQHAAILEANAASIATALVEITTEQPKIEPGIPLSELATKTGDPKPPEADAKGDRKL